MTQTCGWKAVARGRLISYKLASTVSTECRWLQWLSKRELSVLENGAREAKPGAKLGGRFAASGHPSGMPAHGSAAKPEASETGTSQWLFCCNR